MGKSRVTKKLVPSLRDIDAAIMMVNASDPQLPTLALFYDAISHLPFITVLNKTDKVTGEEIRLTTQKLGGEVIPAALPIGRGLPEIRYRLGRWILGGTVKKVAVLGIFNSGKTSLINALTGDNAPVGDIPGTTLELTLHDYEGHLTLVDTTGQIIDISKPLMVSIDLTGQKTITDKLTHCLRQDAQAITSSSYSALAGLHKAVTVLQDAITAGGKLVTCGAGASALVAMEIAGQAQETGIPVLCFTNNFSCAQPVSFAKGALEDETALARYFAGAVNAGDVALGVSASGGTGFVFRFLEMARARKAATIAITENSDTPLGYAADVIIKSDGKPEGPSSSKVQIAHLALGHALILTLADERGVTAEKSIENMLPEPCPCKMMGIK
jgi:D-sedoheptulose 7-phosphate isomerase